MVMTNTRPNAPLFDYRKLVREDLRRFTTRARGRRIRSRVEFAEQCIVLPEGPHKDEYWRPHFQPFTYHVLDQMDRAGFRKFRFTGCVQSGKSFVGVICVLWHLFERGETVGYGVPDLDMSGGDKWREEFMPTIERSPFLLSFMPRSGRGSKGGTPKAIKFRNGATLRFVSGTGGDHHRSNFTLPVIFKTEVDRYDTAGESSRESPPVEQMEARTEAFGDLAFSYEECTVTTPTGRIWSELQESTNAKLFVRCVACRQAVYPTRDDLVGFEDAATVRQARREGRFKCPQCGVLWDEEDRQAMLEPDRLLVVHEGQTVRVGDDAAALIEGELKDTDKLGIHWHAFHNRLWTTEKIAGDEWAAMYSRSMDDMELKRRQFAWTMPGEPDVFAISAVTLADILDRAKVREGEERLPLSTAPPKTLGITAGVDVGKHALHFVVRAWYQAGDAGQVNTRVIDLGTLPVDSSQRGVRRAIPAALRELDDRFASGYRDAAGELHPVALRGVDGGWQGDEVGKKKEYLVWEFLLSAVEEDRVGWLMTLGRGQSEPPGKGSYSHPRSTSAEVLEVGDEWHIRRSKKFDQHFRSAGSQAGACYVMVNSDEWKNYIREGYETPVGEDGAVLSFDAATKDERRALRELGRHTMAETRVRKPVKNRGVVVIFLNNSKRPNHYADADYLSAVMASVLKMPISSRPRPALRATAERRGGAVNSAGQSFLATNR